MKASIFLCLAALISSAPLRAAQSLEFPKENPLIAVAAPDDWKAKPKNGSLFIVSPDGGEVIVEIMPMEAPLDDDAAALDEARGTVSEDFKNLKLTKTAPAKANGLIVTLLGGEGQDKHGAAHINMAVLKHPAAEHPILVSVIAAKDAAEKHGATVGAIFDSIRAVGSAGASDLQTFAYPDAKKPDFTIDFPVDWKRKDTDEGAYVESPDQLVALNLIMVDKADLQDAETTLKKKVGDRFKEVGWNKGGDPEVARDDDLGLTTTFHHAQLSDGAGTEKYSCNLVTYVRKSGDKVLVVLCQNPLRALKKHGDAMEAMIKSVKVR